MVGKGNIGMGKWEVQTVGCKVQGCVVQCGEYSQYFIITKWKVGEGNGNPLQYSCLENPMDGEAGSLQSMGSQRAGHS